MTPGHPQYVDISVYQRPVDWPVYAKWARQWDGIARVAIRVSYGVGYVDQLFQAHRAGALAVDIEKIIYYHYGYPEFNAALAEADWMARVLGNIRPDDNVMLDYEENVKQASAQWAYEWLSRQEQRYQRLPTPYASPDFIAHHLQDPHYGPLLARYPLTEAFWQFSPNEQAPIPSPWRSVAYVQYSDRASVPGMPGGVDANIDLTGNGNGGTEPMLQLSDPMGLHFTELAPNRWHCKATNVDLAYAHLDFYRQAGGILRLPLTNEIQLANLQGAAIVVYEGGVAIYDPNNVAGQKPAGVGAVYLMKLNDGGVGQQIIAKPLLAALQAEVAKLQADAAATPAPDPAIVDQLNANVAKFQAFVNQVDAMIDTLEGKVV